MVQLLGAGSVQPYNQLARLRENGKFSSGRLSPPRVMGQEGVTKAARTYETPEPTRTPPGSQIPAESASRWVTQWQVGHGFILPSYPVLVNLRGGG